MTVNGNNKPSPQESSSLSLVLSEESTQSSCSAHLATRSKISQVQLQNLFCQCMFCGGSNPLLTFKPPFVCNLVAQKDQQGSPALGVRARYLFWGSALGYILSCSSISVFFCPVAGEVYKAMGLGMLKHSSRCPTALELTSPLHLQCLYGATVK